MKKPNLIYCSRLAAVLLVSIFLFVQNAFAQNVALKFDKTPLKEVVEKVQKASGYSFVYSDQNLDTGRLITANYSGPVEPINKLLDAIFAKSGIYYKVNGKQIAISDQLVDDSKKKEGQDAGENGGATVKSGRPFVLRGTVIDNEGQPVVGATVHNLKDNTYTVTNDKGEYSLNVKDARGVSMEFSFLGMNTVVEPLQNRSILNVTMNSDKLFLDEVVVTGYQDIQKKKVTGAIATVSSNKIEERYTSNIMNNLEGRVAGLSTYGGKLTIRGVSSIYAEANPLLVVDGLPIEGSIEDINPYDVESVSILKDAAAAAIYGARASNGIVIIITKGAKTKDKIDIDFSSNVTIKEKQDMDYADNFYMNAAQQVKTESDYYEYYFFNNEGEVTDPIGSTTNSINNGTGEITPILYAYYQLAKGQITRDQLTTTLNSLSKNNFAKEYADKIYRRQVIQQYNLALRSRSDKSQSSFVMNYKTDNSGIINTFDNSLNVSFKGSYDVAKWLT
ncbi:MAG: TonB-dependent receptor plug domain-containing protein, partial [Bacteroidales bacterium]